MTAAPPGRGSALARGSIPRSRNVCAVMAGWLAAASVGLAQSGQPNNAAPAGQARPLSPYFATASTVDRSGGEESQAPPDMMPNMPIPRAPSAPPLMSGPGMALPPG